MALFLALLLMAPALALPFINSDGKRVEVKSHLVREKTNVVFFHAPWSKTSSRYMAELSRWAPKQDDVVVLGVQVKKLGSPVAKQYGLTAVPTFLIFNEKGEETHSGQAALAEVLKMMKE